MTSPAPLAAALQHAAALLETLTPQQLEDVAAGRARLVFRPGASRPLPRDVVHRASGVDVAAVVAEINRLATPGEVTDYLQRHGAAFTVPVLKEIARALGPTVNSTGRTKAQLRRDIVEGTAGFRVRSAAMSGGAWSRP